MIDRSADTTQRPSLREVSSLSEYERQFHEWAKWRWENDTAAPHYKQDYPLVVNCPNCGDPAVVSLISAVDDPIWECKLSSHDYTDSWFSREALNE